MGAIAPIAVASIVAYAANQAFFNLEPMLAVPDMSIELAADSLSIFAGVLSALTSVAYMAAIRKGRELASRSQWSMPQLLMSCVVVVGSISVVLPDVAGLGLTQINGMIDAKFGLVTLFVLLAGKIFVTAYCLNAGFFGGVFGPALFVGAATGAIVANAAIIAGLAPHLSYALPIAAIAAVGGAVIGAPLTAIMIIIELTGSYAYGLSAMLCAILCSLLPFVFSDCPILIGSFLIAE